jgi:hypothetical protein
MSLAEYFENAQGLGVLATADGKGKVDAAVYSRPHVVDETTVAFIMSDRLSHSNLQTNPSAAYLFIEKDHGYVGKRLYLTKIREETDPAAIDAMRRKQRREGSVEGEHKYLVFFRIDEIRPITGSTI